MTTDPKMCACGRFAPTQACVPEKCELHVRELSLARLPGRGPMRQTSTEKEDAARRDKAKQQAEDASKAAKGILENGTKPSESQNTRLESGAKAPSKSAPISALGKAAARFDAIRDRDREENKKCGMGRSR